MKKIVTTLRSLKDSWEVLSEVALTKSDKLSGAMTRSLVTLMAVIKPEFDKYNTMIGIQREIHGQHRDGR